MCVDQQDQQDSSQDFRRCPDQRKQGKDDQNDCGNGHLLGKKKLGKSVSGGSGLGRYYLSVYSSGWPGKLCQGGPTEKGSNGRLLCLIRGLELVHLGEERLSASEGEMPLLTRLPRQ